MKKRNKSGQSIFNKFLSGVEKTGNALPHPATIFALLALSALILSALADILGWSAVHPVTKEVIEPINLISTDGLQLILNKMVSNFTGFASSGNCVSSDAWNWNCRKQRTHKRIYQVNGVICAKTFVDFHTCFFRSNVQRW